MDLTNQEVILIGALAENPGFSLLMTALSAEENNILDQLELAETDEDESRLVKQWRAYRIVIKRQKHIVETLKAQTDEAFQELSPIERGIGEVLLPTK